MQYRICLPTDERVVWAEAAVYDEAGQAVA